MRVASSLLVVLLALPGAAHAADGLTLLRQGDLEAAAPALRAEALASPADLDRQERWIDLMLSLGLPEVVQDHYRSRVRSDPANPDAHYLLGRAATDVAGSVSAYEAALKLDPGHARAWMGLGAIHRAKGELQDAAQAYRRALLKDTRLDEAWGGLLAVFLASQDLPGAATVAREAITRVPQLPEAWLVLAAAEPASARQRLEQGIAQAPWDARLHEALADHLLRSGDGGGALAAAGRALALQPTLRGARVTAMSARDLASGALTPVALTQLTRARETAGTDAAAARQALDALVAQHPRAAVVRLDRAHLRAASDPAGAQADLEAALQLAPKDDEIAASLGQLLRNRGFPERAAPLLDQAALARPHDASLARAAAQAHADAGQLDQALARVRAAEARFPLSLELGVLHVGILSKADRDAEAYEVARAMATRIPDPRAVITAAAAAVEAGRWRDAADHYAEAGKRTGRDEFTRLAETLRARGEAR